MALRGSKPAFSSCPVRLLRARLAIRGDFGTPKSENAGFSGSGKSFRAVPDHPIFRESSVTPIGVYLPLQKFTTRESRVVGSLQL
jgi:hypothetical protein